MKALIFLAAVMLISPAFAQSDLGNPIVTVTNGMTSAINGVSRGIRNIAGSLINLTSSVLSIIGADKAVKGFSKDPTGTVQEAIKVAFASMALLCMASLLAPCFMPLVPFISVVIGLLAAFYHAVKQSQSWW
jgi:hypothetical protein